MRQHTHRWPCLAGLWWGRIQRHMLLCWTFVLCLSMLSTKVMAQATPTENEDATSTNTEGFTMPTALPTMEGDFTPQSIIGALICIGVGIVLGFFGYRFFRPTLFLVGFAVAAMLTYIGCINIKPLESGNSTLETIYIVVTVAIGFIAGILCIVFWRFGIMLIGALGGFIAAVFILAWAPNGLIGDTTSRVLFIVILTVVFALVVFKLERPVIIIATSLAGSFGIVLGIDFFARQGVVTALTTFISSDLNLSYEITAGTYIMLAVLAILAVVCMIVQFHFFRAVFGKPARDSSNA